MGALYPFSASAQPSARRGGDGDEQRQRRHHALRLRGLKRPRSAAEILHPSVGTRLREYAYLAGIALVALRWAARRCTSARRARPRGDGGGRTRRDAGAGLRRRSGITATLVAPPAIQRHTRALTYKLQDALSGAPLTDVLIRHEAAGHRRRSAGTYDTFSTCTRSPPVRQVSTRRPPLRDAVDYQILAELTRRAETRPAP